MPELIESGGPDQATGGGPDRVAGGDRIRVRRRSRRWRRRVLRRRLLLAGGVLAGVALVGTVQLALAGWQLWVTAERVATAQDAMAHGEVERAEELAADAHDSASRADLLSSGPHLWLAGLLPLVGDDVEAVRTVAEVGDELTGPVAEQLFDLRVALDPERIRPVRGHLDLDRFRTAEPRMQQVSEAFAGADARLEQLATGGLVPLLAEGVSRVADEVAALHDSTAVAADVLAMMPTVLGADEPRRYLIVFGNNAELRTTGGIPGAFAVLEADDGHLAMREQGAVPDLGGALRAPVLPTTEEEQALFAGKLGRFVQDANLTPDWTRSAELLAARWQQVAGTPVDGVLSVDPVVLSHILEGVDRVRLPDGKHATPETAVQVLLNQPYLDYETQAEQDAFFETSAGKIFDQLVRGRGEAGQALAGLYTGVREGRVFVWLADSGEQARIASTAVAGRLAGPAGQESGSDRTGSGAQRPRIGVYLNDSTGTKLDYYLTSRTDVQRLGCLGTRQRLRVTTVLTSRVPGNAEQFPALLLGAETPGPAGSVLTTVLTYGPVGSTITDPVIDGRRGAPADFTHQGHPVVARTVLLQPGQRITLSWTIETAPGQTGAPILRTTPGAHTDGVGTVESGSCG